MQTMPHLSLMLLLITQFSFWKDLLPPTHPKVTIILWLYLLLRVITEQESWQGSCFSLGYRGWSLRGMVRSFTGRVNVNPKGSFASHQLCAGPSSHLQATVEASVKTEGYRESPQQWLLQNNVRDQGWHQGLQITKPQNHTWGLTGNLQDVNIHRLWCWASEKIKVKGNLPSFKLMESTVKRRYSDFEWLRSELERENKTLVLLVPGKAFFFFG
jgi:hypothetical protein